jgi:argininosuccinate lyase
MTSRYANDVEISKAQRDFELKKAQYDMEVQTKAAQSELAYDLQVPYTCTRMIFFPQLFNLISSILCEPKNPNVAEHVQNRSEITFYF